MAEIRFFKVLVLPNPGVPNSMYAVQALNGFCDFYITDKYGVPEPTGSSEMITYYINQFATDIYYYGEAGMPISGGKVIYSKNGLLYHYDPTDAANYRGPIGISVTAANTGTQVKVQTLGVFHEVGLGLISDTDYFAGANGALITDPSLLPICQFIGRAVDTEHLKIEIQIPILTA